MAKPVFWLRSQITQMEKTMVSDPAGGGEPVPDTRAAIRFLIAFHGSDGPFHLVGIAEGAPVQAATFTGVELDEMATWIQACQSTKNVYHHVNLPFPALRNAKARKEDMEWATYLHVDIDDLDALGRLSKFSPAPTAVVMSGGGYQAFWKLASATDDLERVERSNKWIAEQLGGDKTHNVDRIMRVPFTVNVPNQKKRAAGRVAALAYVVEELTDWSRSHSLDEFPQASVDAAPGPAEVLIGEIPEHVELSELPGELPPKTKQIIVAGDDPDAPRGSKTPHFRSRSEAVFRVVVDLVRASVADETIISLLSDPKYGISESVREKRRPLQYANRQLANAKAVVTEGWPDVSKAGAIRSTYANTVLGIRRLGIVGEYDEFHRRKMLAGIPVQSFQGDLSDDACSMLRHAILDTFGFDPGKSNTIEAANFICLESVHHPVREYLDGLEWDGQERLSQLLSNYFGAEDTPLNRAIARAVITAAVRRIRRPGTKFDNVLVLEGPQGSGKSTAVRILAGDENFSDQEILGLDPKQQIEAMEGVWIFEISELSGLNRSEIQRVKAFVSRQVDHGRPAYARFIERRPRQTIFIGTTNEDTYLRDLTGNRRFWPVRTGAIDLVNLRQDRDQILAEACAAETAGEDVVLPEKLWAAAAVEQEARLEEHPWVEKLAGIRADIANGKERIATEDILTRVLSIPADRQQPHQLKLIASTMRHLGWEGPKKLKINGRTLRGYERDTDELDRAIPTF